MGRCTRTYLPRVHQINNVHSLFLLPLGPAMVTCGDVLRLDSHNLSNGGGRVLAACILREKRRVQGIAITFHTKVINKEAMTRLDHVRIVEGSRLFPVVDEFDEVCTCNHRFSRLGFSA